MSEIKMHSVVSSNISKAGYDEKNERMNIHFTNGAKYEYHNVPKHVYEGIFKADSPGGYFRKWVAKSGYKFNKIK